MVKTRFVGSGRSVEGLDNSNRGFATHKRDFDAHTEGGDWFHGATDIQMEPAISVGSGSFSGATVQATLEAIASTYISGGQGFVAIGDGYNSCAQDLALAFNNAFLSPRLANGGVILVKAGTYCIEQTVVIPPGITVLGEPSGTVITQGNNLAIQEQPLFDIQASTLQPQTGTAMVESQDKTKFIDLIIYDNLNDYTGLTPFLNTVSFFRCERGSDLLIDSCTIVGKAISTAAITIGVVEYIVAASTSSTILTIQNSYIDNVSTVATFNGTQGATDWVTIKNNRLKTYGLGTVQSMLTTTNANLQVSGNHHTGDNSWGAAHFINITGGAVSDANTEFNILGNSGGIIGLTDPNLVNNEPSTAITTKNNTWGGGCITMSSRVVVEGETYVLQDADYGTTLTFSGSRCIIDCRTITTIGREVGFDLTYSPVDGEELMITVVNHATRTPSISYIDFDISVFKNTQYLSDQQCPDPRPGGITNYRFIYNGISQGFDLISKTASVWSTTSTIPYDRNKDDLITIEPQKSLSAIKKMSAGSASTYDDTGYTAIKRCVYSRNIGALLGSGTSTSISYTEDGSNWGDVDVGTTIPGGNATRIAVTDETGAGAIALVSGQVSTAVLKVSLNHYSFGPVYSSGAAVSIGITGTITINSIMYQGPGSNRFLVAHQDGISLIEGPSYNTEITSSLNTAAGNNIIDMARAPDGRIMVVGDGYGGANRVWIYIPVTSGDFATTPTFTVVAATGLSGDPRKVTFNRVLNRWYIHTDDSTGYYYSTNNGTNFSATSSPSLGTGPGVISDLQMVGNLTIACYQCSNGTGWGGLYYLNHSTGGWKSISVNNSDGSGFITVAWVGGKLIAINEYVAAWSINPISVSSIIDCGIYGLLDFDK